MVILFCPVVYALPPHGVEPTIPPPEHSKWLLENQNIVPAEIPIPGETPTPEPLKKYASQNVDCPITATPPPRPFQPP